nr:NADH dehydrogenase subunit 6 [Oxylipeurus chiniri]
MSEVIHFILVFLLYVSPMMVFLSNSVLISIIFIIIYLLALSGKVWLSLNSSFCFFLVVLSLIGGMMVLISFVFLSLPEKSEVKKIFSKFEWIFLFIFSIIPFFMMSVDESKAEALAFILSFPPSMWGKPVLFGPFLSTFLFLAILLFFVLFVVDSLLRKESGSLLSKTHYL